MDPTANLEEQRRLASWLSENIGSGRDTTVKAERLAALVTALDEWISNGGFLPRQWDQDLRRPRW
jgi:hypothetical protein